MHLPFLIRQTPETLTTFRKLVELDLVVISFIQNYELLKCYTINLNPRTYKQSHTPTVVQGGGVDGPPLGFRYVTIF